MNTVRCWLLLAAVLWAGSCVAPVSAQTLPSAPVPVPSPPSAPVAPPLLAPPPPDTHPPATDLISPPPPPIYFDPLPTHGDLSEPTFAPPGWFGAVEMDILKPHLKDRVSGNVYYNNGFYDTIQLPSAGLDWTVSPRFELGYRFWDGCGEIAFSYRYLGSQGRADLPNFDFFANNPDGTLKTHLSVNVFDIDYGTREFSLGSHWDLKARLGVRIADVLFHSDAFGDITEQYTRNHFTGAGPHAALDVWYHFNFFGLGLFTRLEGALLIGRVYQYFDESFDFGDGQIYGSNGSQSATRAVPMLNAQFGLGWQPPGTRLRFSAGYQYEYWWGIGHAGASSAELFEQGAFLRAEFCF